MALTSLHVKLPHGTNSVKLSPALTPGQYVVLQLLMEKPQSANELRRSIEDLARRWEVQVEFDGA